MFLQGFIGCGWTERKTSVDKSFELMTVHLVEGLFVARKRECVFSCECK